MTAGKDDAKYQKLMEAHKLARQDPSQSEVSRGTLKAAQKLVKEGDVSDNVIMAMQYLG